VTANKAMYPKIVNYVVYTCAVLFTIFGFYCAMAFGSAIEKDPLITEILPHSWPVWTIKILFILNLITSQPLQFTPVSIVIEGYLFKDWPKSTKRQWSKNLLRFILIVLICVSTTALGDFINKFLSVQGALTVTPVAITFPAIFHLKTCAKTQTDKAIDWFIIILSGLIFVLCGYNSISEWND
jgi:hypothetical protein